MKTKNPTKPLPRDKYWERKMEGGPLPFLKKPCGDCAMTCGFYEPIADELLKEDTEVQDKVLERWFCHNHSNRACKGAYDYILEKRVRTIGD